MITKTEHNEHCREIANYLDEIVSGSLFTCPECGEEFNTLDAYTNEDEGIEWACPHCHKEDEGFEFEQVGIWDYLEDVFDIRYTFNGSRDFIGCELLVAFGGPNIWVDTIRREVRLVWWNERGSFDLSIDVCDAIDECVEGLWGC